MWKFGYEIQTEIVSPASFSLLDPGSMENFMTVVYDCSQNYENQLLKPSDVKYFKGLWNETKNVE